MTRITLLSLALLTALTFTGCTSLYVVVEGDDMAKAKKMVESGTPVDRPYGGGYTPLMAASLNGNYEMAKYLIDRGANVNNKGGDGSTALIWAVRQGKLDVARLLLEKGANPDVDNFAGENPLITSATNGHVDLARMLVDKGADVNHKGKEGVTPVFAAVLNKNTELVKLFLEKGADPNVANEGGDTALHIAAVKGLTETVKVLLAKGAKVNVASKINNTPLILASSRGHTDIALLLIAQGADLSARGQEGKTAREWAQIRNHPETVRALEGAANKEVVAVIAVPNEELDALIAKNDPAALRAFLDAHPETLSCIKDEELRFRYTGPAEMRIIDIAQMAKDNSANSLIIAQINSAGGPYKKFTASDISALKKMKISDEVVTAMIDVTTTYNKERKILAEKKPVQEAPVVQVVQQAPPVQQPPAQQEAPNSLPECIQLAAALKACDQAGGFLSVGCKAVARSQFNCPNM